GRPKRCGGVIVIRSLLVLAAVAVGVVLTTSAPADDKAKDVKVTGTLACAKCKLKMDGIKECKNALSVKDGDKTVVYLLDDKGEGEEYHECGGSEKKDVTVTGAVTEKDGHKWLKPTKVEVKKDK